MLGSRFFWRGRIFRQLLFAVCIITIMRTKSNKSKSAADIWQRVIEFEGELPLSAARALLKLHFSEHDQMVMDGLSAKASAGILSPQEQLDIDTFERLGCLLDIIHSKARQALKKKPKRAS
jgi:hypothetical protein